MTSSDLKKALAVGGAVCVTIGVANGKPEYCCAIRQPGLASWKLTYDADPDEALRRALAKLQDKDDLI